MTRDWLGRTVKKPDVDKEDSERAGGGGGEGRGRRTAEYRSVQTQTAVRDGETQTMPCALDMTCNLGTRIELLEIAFTAHGLSVRPSPETSPRLSITYRPIYLTVWWRLGSVGNVVGRINEVNQRRARLVLGWVTVFKTDKPSLHVTSHPTCI